LRSREDMRIGVGIVGSKASLEVSFYQHLREIQPQTESISTRRVFLATRSRCSTRTSALRRKRANSRCFRNGSSQGSDFNVSGARLKPASAFLDCVLHPSVPYGRPMRRIARERCLDHAVGRSHADKFGFIPVRGLSQ